MSKHYKIEVLGDGGNALYILPLSAGTQGQVLTKASGSQTQWANSGNQSTLQSEQLTITAENTISSLTKTPTSTSNVLLIVNGLIYDTLGTTPSFSISGKNITWNAANAGFSLMTTDRAIAQYPTLE